MIKHLYKIKRRRYEDLKCMISEFCWSLSFPRSSSCCVCWCLASPFCLHRFYLLRFLYLPLVYPHLVSVFFVLIFFLSFFFFVFSLVIVFTLFVFVFFFSFLKKNQEKGVYARKTAQLLGPCKHN